MDDDNRVVVLIDMDCFYCQVEEKLDPKLSGKPIAVVQYNPWMGGGIIAVNYVARARGVTRHMRGKEAKEKCPDIELPSVPCLRGKADITKYRDAGKDVAKVLQRFTPLFERASIDEAYMDITVPVQERLKTLNVNSVNTTMMPNTYALGYDCVDEFLADIHTGGVSNIDFDYNHAIRLLVGAVMVSEIRAAVYEETGYRCSAGIAHNKILAKLVCGMNKPNKQTVLPKHSVNILYSTLPVKKVKHLGGKFGYTVCEVLKISTMGDLQKFTEKQLQAKFDDKNGTWLFNIARGIDAEPVLARFNPKSIGCCKNFKGKAALSKLETLQKWLKDLGEEIDDRLEKDALENNRTPKQMVVSYSLQLAGRKDTSSSRSYNFTPDDELCAELFTNKALELLMESSEGIKIRDIGTNKKLKAPITFLGISVGKFEDNVDIKKTKTIHHYFAGVSKDDTVDKLMGNSNQENINNEETIDKSGTKNIGKEYIMKKFLGASDKASTTTKDLIPNEKPTGTASSTNIPVLESTLDKQESFFAKMLNQNRKDHTKTRVQNAEVSIDKIRPTTPDCDIVACGQDSNDSHYSSSTINNEINNSVALFEEDPQDVARVTSIRELLSSSRMMNEDDSETAFVTENNTNATSLLHQREQYPDKDSFQCPECRKSIPIHMVPEHSDYHMALKLRDEERQLSRHKKQNTIVKRKENEELKKTQISDTVRNESMSSIASYLVKIDENIPIEVCAECGKKIPLDKFGEHLDFHEAKKLSRQLNKKDSPVHSGSNVKRKRKSASPIKKNKVPCRTIESFFR